MTAVVDGLAIQEAIDDDFDMRRAYAVLEFMLAALAARAARLGPAWQTPSPTEDTRDGGSASSAATRLVSMAHREGTVRDG